LGLRQNASYNVSQIDNPFILGFQYYSKDFLRDIRLNYDKKIYTYLNNNTLNVVGTMQFGDDDRSRSATHVGRMNMNPGQCFTKPTA
jgi:hypothetical protein